jgi:hypothetical protein
MKILINGTRFEIVSVLPHASWAPIVYKGVMYDIDKGDDLQSIAHAEEEELTITLEGSDIKEITILDRVWLRNDAGTYSRKLDPALPTLPFPQPGQVVNLNGVELEVLHIHGAHFFWYNHEDSFHGVAECADIQPSLIETMRADLAKGLGPKELIALGWSRKC